MDSRFQIFGAKTTPDIRSGLLGIVIGPETISPDMSGGPTDFREDWCIQIPKQASTLKCTCIKQAPVLTKQILIVPSALA